MKLKIIDQDLNEYIFNEFAGDAYVFSFNAFPRPTFADCDLTISNNKEIPMEQKIKLLELYKKIKEIDIKTIVLEVDSTPLINLKNEDPDEIEKLITSFSILFNSNSYNLDFISTNYKTSYQSESSENTLETIELSFYFIHRKE